MVRGRFPALASEVALLDGPAGAQVPFEVIDAMSAYLRDANANLGGAFGTSAVTGRIVRGARAALADFTARSPTGSRSGRT